MKASLTFPDGTTIEADLSSKGLLAVHKPLDTKEKGYVLTEVSSIKVLIWVRRKADAVKIRNDLEKAEDLGKALEALHAPQCSMTDPASSQIL